MPTQIDDAAPTEAPPPTAAPTLTALPTGPEAPTVTAVPTATTPPPTATSLPTATATTQPAIIQAYNTPFTVQPGGENDATLSCPHGQIVSPGFELPDSSLALPTLLMPNAANESLHAAVRNYSQTSVQTTLEIVCANVTLSHTVAVGNKTVATPGGGIVGAADCPPASSLTGGGYTVSLDYTGSPPQFGIGYDGPHSTTEWWVDVQNLGSQTFSFTVYAICYQSVLTTLEQGSASVPAGGNGVAGALPCPAGSVVTSEGYQWGDPPSPATRPDARQKVWLSEYNTSSQSWSLDAYSGANVFIITYNVCVRFP